MLLRGKGKRVVFELHHAAERDMFVRCLHGMVEAYKQALTSISAADGLCKVRPLSVIDMFPHQYGHPDDGGSASGSGGGDGQGVESDSTPAAAILRSAFSADVESDTDQEKEKRPANVAKSSVSVTPVPAAEEGASTGLG